MPRATRDRPILRAFIMLRVIAILFVLVVFVAMVYGPIAAMLVEMFPTRVRCSSVSLPYHLGNGWFGGLLPSAVLAICGAKRPSSRPACGCRSSWRCGSATGRLLLWLRETKGTTAVGRRTPNRLL